MTSIIQPLTPPAGAPNVSATIAPPPGMVVGAGTTYYGNGNFLNLFGAHLIDGFNNAGVIWNHSTANVSGALTGTYTYGIVNSGTMMAYSSDGNAYGISAGSGGDYVGNSGKLYAVTERGNAYGIWSFDSFQRVVNSGVIAAQALAAGSAGVGDAVAISLFNGGQVVNEAGGSILGEGVYGRALLIGRASNFGGEAQVINHGLIAAATLNAANPSVAINFGYLGGSAARIDNDGTIRGDIAIQSNESSYNPFTRGGMEVRNLTGGAIEGALDLATGDDRVINNGTLTGNVSTGTGRDIFDTSGGIFNGTADLGWEEDSFFGSAAGDVVKGNRGADTLNGNGGNDLLLGGTGDDVIAGGAGNDGLYGESGKDRIATEGGDAAWGGDGDDVIRAGDLSFARIDGGAGFDTLEFAGAGLRLDLAAAVATGRLTGIDRIALEVNQQLTIRGGDATALAGASGKLLITGVSSDAVVLVGDWVAGGVDTVPGFGVCRSFTLGNETVYVSYAINISNPGDTYTGLSPIAAGGAAPVAGSVTGGELMNALQTNVTVTNHYGSLTVDLDETWSNTNQTFVWGYGAYAQFINNGTLLATANPGNAFNAISGNDFASIFNTGTIRVTGTGTAYVSAISTSSTAVVKNHGLIDVIADQGRALGVRASKYGAETGILLNGGIINAQSNAGAAIGAQVIGGASPDASEPAAYNWGQINATGGAGTIAVEMFAGGRFVNLHSIVARNTEGSGANDAIGMTIYSNSGGVTQLENSSSITGVVAVKGTGGAAVIVNHGTLTGAVALFDENDFVKGTGIITGPITLGGGRDYLDNSEAQRAVQADGGAGDDVMVGRSGDTLTGGAGKDHFRFTAPGTGTITDFVSGTDVLDIAALSPTNVVLTNGTGETTVTVTSAQGTLTLRVQGTIAMSDIITTSRFRGDAGDNPLFAMPEGSTLNGLEGADLLFGMAGHDVLNGGAGNDVMAGGHGNDSYWVDSATDVIREFDYEGYDTIYIDPAAVAAGLIVRMATGVERMIGGSGIGNALDNIMIGSDGNDTLMSWDVGLDRLSGGQGNDTYYVTGLDDIVFENAGGGTDKVLSDTSFYLYANIEELEIGGQDGSFGVGNELNNKITGSAYANLLLGGAGNDEIKAGAGADVVYGEAGDDTLRGEYNVDFLAGGAGNDMLDGGLHADALHGEDGDDTLIGGDDFVTDILVGGAGNDVLRGDSGQADYDLMDGGSGDDVYYVDTGDDLTFEAVNGGTDTVYANVAGANNGVYLYANVENLVLVGATAFGVGNELANVLTGSASANWLLGGAGKDVINGKGGNDVLFGEDGADRFVFERGTGGDVIGDFAVGTDKIDLTAFGFSWQTIVNSMHEHGGTTAIDLGNGDFIVLNGVSASTLSQSDFMLASSMTERGDLMDAAIEDPRFLHAVDTSYLFRADGINPDL